MLSRRATRWLLGAPVLPRNDVPCAGVPGRNAITVATACRPLATLPWATSTTDDVRRVLLPQLLRANLDSQLPLSGVEVVGRVVNETQNCGPTTQSPFDQNRPPYLGECSQCL